MNANVQNVVKFFESVVSETDKILVEWNNGSLKFPQLLNLVGTKLNVSGDDLKAADSFIRYHVKKHPDFHASRGAKGGIEPMATYQSRVKAKEAKKAVKADLAKVIDAKVAGSETVSV